MLTKNSDNFIPGYILVTAPSILNIKNILCLKKAKFTFADGEKYYIIIIMFLGGDTMALAYPDKKQRDEQYTQLNKLLLKDKVKVINGTK